MGGATRPPSWTTDPRPRHDACPKSERRVSDPERVHDNSRGSRPGALRDATHGPRPHKTTSPLGKGGLRGVRFLAAQPGCEQANGNARTRVTNSREVENLEILFFSTRMKGGQGVDLPVLADFRLPAIGAAREMT